MLLPTAVAAAPSSSAGTDGVEHAVETKSVFGACSDVLLVLNDNGVDNGVAKLLGNWNDSVSLPKTKG